MAFHDLVWRGFNRIGAFVAGQFKVFAGPVLPDSLHIESGERVLRITDSGGVTGAFPPNVYAPTEEVDPDDELPSVGHGQRFVFDAGGTQEQTVEIGQPRTGSIVEDDDGHASGVFERWRVHDGLILAADVVAPVDLGLADSPPIYIGHLERGAICRVTGHALDDRGNDATTSPRVTFECLFAAVQDGDYIVDAGVVPPEVPERVSATEDGVTDRLLNFPPYPWMKIRPVVDATDANSGAGDRTVFSLELLIP